MAHPGGADRPLRLAFFVVRCFPYGGMQRNLLRIAQACVERGCEVDIYTGSWEGPLPTAMGVIQMPLRAFTNQGRNRRLGERFRQLTSGQGYQCRVGFNKIPGLDVYYAADPCFAAQAAQRGRWFRLTPRYRQYCALEEAVFGVGRGVDILLHAHGEQARFSACYATEAERFVALPPGLDRQRLDAGLAAPAELRGRLGLDRDSQLLLAVGSHFHTKGLDRTIGALPGLADKVHLLVVGESRSGSYGRLARRLGVAQRVHFMGAADAALYYPQASALIHPARRENTGGVLLEAMYCGLPVLVTANCGYAFHVERAAAGVVVAEPFDQAAFHQALAAFLTSPQLTTWGQQGRNYCRREDLYSLVEGAANAIIARAMKGLQTAPGG